MTSRSAAPGRSRSRAAVVATILAVVLAAFVSLLAAPSPVHAQQDAPAPSEDTAVVDILPIEGLLDPPAVAAITDVIEDAARRGSALVVVQLDSPGAVKADLDGLLATIEASPVPVAVFVGPATAGAEARGGAALLALAGHITIAAPDAVIGPLEPIDLSGDVDAAALLAIVDQVPEVLVSGVATGEALEATGVIELTARGLQPLLTELDGRTVETVAGPVELRLRTDEVAVRFHSLGLVRRALHAATTPVFIYLLLVVGLGMLLFEVFQPGFGVAGFAGLITAGIGLFGVTVLPVAWWALALVVLGLVLFAVDTAIAGFGPVTVGATTAFAVGSSYLYDSPQLGVPGWLIAVTTLSAVVFFVGVMTVVLRAQAGPDVDAVDHLVGRVGMVRSVLNPEGHVYIDDALWRARWTGDTRRAKVGTPVRVHGVDGAVLLVEAFDPQAARSEVTARRA